jgi:hypothetical protein
LLTTKLTRNENTQVKDLNYLIFSSIIFTIIIMTVNATLAPSSADTAEAGNGGAPSAGNSAKFDPTEHLDYQPPSKIWTMQELDFPEDQGISPMSVSEPFPLFSKAAVREMRKEILSRPVWENHRFQSKHAQCQLRGYARRHAPFTYGAWHDPRVLGIISKIAGIELVPNMDYEVAHINISGSDVAKLNPFGPDAEQQRPKPAPEDDEPRKDKGAIVGWHQDSYPFVCVTMLSDCTDMVGGETALKTGKGEVVKVRGPQMVGRAPWNGNISPVQSSSNISPGLCRRSPRPLHRPPGPPNHRRV